MKTHIIAFVAPKGFGKTTACRMIAEHYDVTQLNFKDGLIRELKQNFPNLLSVLSERYSMDIDTLFSMKPAEVRALMQNYGSEVRRGDDPDYWVLQWKLALADVRTPLVLNDDTRFLNEAAAVKAYGGTLIQIDREDMIAEDMHISETEQQSIKCDYKVTTSEGNHEQFKRDLLAIVQQIMV